MSAIAVKVKSIADIYVEGIKYIVGRQKGVVKSIRTPWSKVNKAGVGGFEWGTIITLGGRSGTGKTTFVNYFTRRAHQLNPDQEFDVVDLQFEMPDKQTAVREFSSVTGLKYEQLLSGEVPLDNNVIDEIKVFITMHKDRRIFSVDTPMTVKEIRQFLIDYYEENKRPMIVTLDHSVLVKNDRGELSKMDMLGHLGEMLTEMKKKVPIIFIILTQMNRGIEDHSRRLPGHIGNYPTAADIFGADALYQHSDIVMVLNHPWKLHIKEYGPEKWQVGPETMALHFIKSRNGSNKICFFDFNGDSNSFTQMDINPPNAANPNPQNTIAHANAKLPQKPASKWPTTGFALKP